MNKLLVILPDTGSDQALMFCEKLSRTMENSALFESPGTQMGLSYSVSAGIAQAAEDSQLDILLNEAKSRQNVFYECRF
jgi:GGDEF domain-containing protein